MRALTRLKLRPSSPSWWEFNRSTPVSAFISSFQKCKQKEALCRRSDYRLIISLLAAFRIRLKPSSSEMSTVISLFWRRIEHSFHTVKIKHEAAGEGLRPPPPPPGGETTRRGRPARCRYHKSVHFDFSLQIKTGTRWRSRTWIEGGIKRLMAGGAHFRNPAFVCVCVCD